MVLRQDNDWKGREKIGCSDGNCTFDAPGGMHTNGGCQCLEGMSFEQRSKVKRWASRAKRDIGELRAEVMTLEDMCLWLAEKAWKKRDAHHMPPRDERHDCTECPNNHDCRKCWLEAARLAVVGKQ